MKFRRCKPEPPAPRANPTRIAVLECDLLGIQPEPGTAAWVVVALRQFGNCLAHQPADVTICGGAHHARCIRCGRSMIQGDDGVWQVARTTEPARNVST
jgi:hypothetical protein